MLLLDLWDEVNRTKQFGPSSVCIRLNSIFQVVDLNVTVVLMFVFLSYAVNYEVNE